MRKRNLIITAGVAVNIIGAYIYGFTSGVEETKERYNVASKEYEIGKLTMDNLLMQKAIDNLVVSNNRKEVILSVPPVVLETAAQKFSDNFKTAKFEISAYSPLDDRNGLNSWGDGTVTATGTTPRPGTFAVDPDVIPYGSEITIMYPDGTVEHGVAEDTGGAIKGHRIDVFRRTFDTAIMFGMKEAVVIWTPKGGEKL